MFSSQISNIQHSGHEMNLEEHIIMKTLTWKKLKKYGFYKNKLISYLQKQV